MSHACMLAYMFPPVVLSALCTSHASLDQLLQVERLLQRLRSICEAEKLVIDRAVRPATRSCFGSTLVSTSMTQ